MIAGHQAHNKNNKCNLLVANTYCVSSYTNISLHSGYLHLEAAHLSFVYKGNKINVSDGSMTLIIGGYR